MLRSQKSFEETLRSSPSVTHIITPLKIEIHKGCTGKAHACGTIKKSNSFRANKFTTSRQGKLNKIEALNESNTLRKNSVSSETISDSGSESLNSNCFENSTKISPEVSAKPSLARNTSLNQRKKIFDPNNKVKGKITGIENDRFKITQRKRLLSDGDGRQTPNANILSLRRNSSFSSKNIPPPPVITQKTNLASTTPKQNGNSFNKDRLRSSFNKVNSKNQAVNWRKIWEDSHGLKSNGGNLREIDKRVISSEVIRRNCLFL